MVKTLPYPGIPEALAEWSAQGMSLAVLPNKAHPDTLSIVDHFVPGACQAVFGMRPEVPAKPNPTGALEIAGQLELEPASCIYLGDSNVDMETAVAADMFPVGAGWGYRPREELLRSGAREVMESPAELLRLIHD